MPWYEIRRCLECAFEWEIIHDSRGVDVGAIDSQQSETFTLYSCPECYLHLRVLSVSDANSWRHWNHARSKTAIPNDPYEKLIASVSEQVSVILSCARSVYQPIPIALAQIDCVQCKVPLILGSVERPEPMCPQCGNLSKAIEFGHVILEPLPGSEEDV